MWDERLLVAGAVVILVGFLVAAMVVPGAIAAPDQDRDRPGKLNLRDMAIVSGEISGDTAELIVQTRLSHAGPTAENVTIELRATSLDSGLLEATTRMSIAQIKGDREVTVNGTLPVARQGGYRIEAILFNEGRRLETAARQVKGVGALTPAYATSEVEFHDFRATDQPAIEYRIDQASNRTATLAVTTYLSNTGDGTAGGLELVLKARQADSEIVADSTGVRVGQIEAGRTATPSAELEVPNGYNYYLDAQLWADGVIVGTARSAANLNPTETLSVDQTRREVQLEVSEFESEPERAPVTEEAAATAAPGQPGFSTVIAIVAILVAVVVTRRARP